MLGSSAGTPELVEKLRAVAELLQWWEAAFHKDAGGHVLRRRPGICLHPRDGPGIKNQIFKFRETARRQPNPIRVRGAKKNKFLRGPTT